MPNQKISDLTTAAPLLLTDTVLIARGAAPPNLKASVQDVLALGGGVGGGGTIDRIPIFTSPNVLGNSRLNQSAFATSVLSGDFSVDVGGLTVGLLGTARLGKFHVRSSVAGAIAPRVDADEAVFESGGNTGFSLYSDPGGISTMQVGDSSDDDKGSITFDHTASRWDFNIGGASRANLSLAGLYTISNGLVVTAGGGLISAGDFGVTAGDVAFGRTVISGIPLTVQATDTRTTDMVRMIQGSTGDCVLGFVLTTGVDYMMGTKNDDNDAFYLSRNLTPLTTNPIFRVDSVTRDMRIYGALEVQDDLFFTGATSGMDVANIFVKDNASTTTLNSAAKVQFLHFNANGPSHSATPDHTNNHITAARDGLYKVICSLTIENAAGSAHVADASVWLNNGATELLNVHSHRTLAAGTDIGSVTLSGTAELNVGDTVEVWLDGSVAADRDVIVSDASLTVDAKAGIA